MPAGVCTLFMQTVEYLRNILWNLLSSMEEELSVATSSSLSLLAALYSPPARFQADAALAGRLPVLWPFLSHTLTSARLAAATCLGRVVAAGVDAAAAAAGEVAGAWLKSVVGPTLRLLLQCMVVDQDSRLQQALLCAWSALLQHACKQDVEMALSVRDIRSMLQLMSSPCGQPLDVKLLLVALPGRLVAWGSSDAEEAGLCLRPAKRIKQEPGLQKRSASSQLLGAFGDEDDVGSAAVAGPGLDPEVWAGADDQQSAVRMRLLTSRALAQLCESLQGQVSSYLGHCC